MTTTINAQATNGLLTTADGSGIVKLQSDGKTTNSIGWINFGYVSSSVTTRASYNISSVTRNGTGIYTLAFTNTTSDANYILSGCVEGVATSLPLCLYSSSGIGNAPSIKTTSQCQILCGNGGGYDFYTGSLMFFGN